MNVISNGVADTAVIVVDNSSLDVDLGFVPSRSMFFKKWENMSDLGCFGTLIVVDKNPERAIKKVQEHLAECSGTVTLVWNADKQKAFSYSMLSLASRMEYSGFKLVGSTARLELANREESIKGRQVSVGHMRDLLIERTREPSKFTSFEIDALIGDQSELIDDAERSLLEQSKHQSEIEMLRMSVEQIPQLHRRVRELQSENLRLKRRNDEMAIQVINEITRHEGASANSNKNTTEGLK